MAAALLPGLLLLALSRGFPLAAAGTIGLSVNLTSVQYLKPSQTSTKVTFHIFANQIDNTVTHSLDEKWYAVELSKNENQTFVHRILPDVASDFTCCTGEKLINYHASYEGDVKWSETCPEDFTEHCLGTESATSATNDHHNSDASSTQNQDTKPSPTASDTGNSTTQESATSDPQLTQHRDTKAPSTQQLHSKAPSTENPDRKAPSTENPDHKVPSTENPDRKAPSTENPDRKTSTQLSDSKNPSTEHLVTKAPSTQNPDVKAPSNFPDPGLSSSTEAPAGVSVLLFVLTVAGMLLALEV